MKHRLAGNITQSYNLEDEDNYFWKSVLYNLVNMYQRDNGGEHPDIRPHIDEESLKPNFVPFLKEFWVNYQYKHEYQPTHNHGGAYSFVIWLKIPTDYEEQNKDNTANTKLNSCFEIQYLNVLGETCMYRYQLTKDDEGTMLFFPSRLLHAVYPYYNCDDERVSISGNVWLNTDVTR